MFGDLVIVKKGTPKSMKKDDNPTFDQWKKRVDRLISICAGGLISDDLPDQPYRDWYDTRLRPVWAAKRAVENQY